MFNIHSQLSLSHEAATFGPWAIALRSTQIKKVGISLMPRAILPSLLLVSVELFCPSKALPQGETTSAIIGQVSDASGAPVPNAKVTVTNKDTGLRRSASTDDSGRFNFPQLKPGPYSVKVEA